MAEQAEEREPIIEYAKYGIFAKPLQGSNRSPRLAWGSLKGNPRMTVFTNTPSDTVNSGIIYAGFNPETMFELLDAFKYIIDNGIKSSKVRIKNYTIARDATGNGAATGEKKLLCEAIAGKDERGINYVSLIAEDRPKIKFEFRISDFHEIFHNDGTPYSEEEASDAQAKAAIKGLTEIYLKCASDARPPAVPRTNQPYQKSNQSSYGASRAPDLDINSDVF